MVGGTGQEVGGVAQGCRIEGPEPALSRRVQGAFIAVTTHPFGADERDARLIERTQLSAP